MRIPADSDSFYTQRFFLFFYLVQKCKRQTSPALYDALNMAQQKLLSVSKVNSINQYPKMERTESGCVRPKR